MTNPLFHTATDAAAMIKRGDIAARELAELLLARIEERDPEVNAIVELRRAGVLKEAAAADDALARGEDVGPLHGVPITIKDAFNVAGLHTTWGNEQSRDYIAAHVLATACLAWIGTSVATLSGPAEVALAFKGQPDARLVTCPPPRRRACYSPRLPSTPSDARRDERSRAALVSPRAGCAARVQAVRTDGRDAPTNDLVVAGAGGSVASGVVALRCLGRGVDGHQTQLQTFCADRR
ncbi:MAG: amidase family protein [Jatrophihabitans sp.]